ncbi:MAG: ABC transporter ATP-binding protein [Candidatus Limnocylindria bacterium]
MPQRGATVELRGVSKRYGGGTLALDDLSLEVPAGSICALVGPSGGGKTTALKVVNRLVEPTSGKVLIDGTDVLREDPVALRRRIGYVIQQVGLFPHRTIGENVATVPELVGWDRARVRARVTELLKLVGLDPAAYATRYPAQLSGGERQRVGVARALAAEPPVMLMDEPFGAVDPIVRERLQDEFLRIQERLGMTVLFVTHDIDEAIKMGDRVAVLRGGHLVQYAPPADLLEHPADDFVARFVGADRGLKRLSLIPVGDLEPRQARTVHEGDAVERSARDGDPHVLVLDAAGRPLGWVNVLRVRGERFDRAAADPSSPVFSRTTRARDALSMLMAGGVRHGLVVNDQGAYESLVALDDLVSLLGRREPDRPAPGPAAP